MPRRSFATSPGVDHLNFHLREARPCSPRFALCRCVVGSRVRENDCCKKRTKGPPGSTFASGVTFASARRQEGDYYLSAQKRTFPAGNFLVIDVHNAVKSRDGYQKEMAEEGEVRSGAGGEPREGSRWSWSWHGFFAAQVNFRSAKLGGRCRPRGCQLGP